MKKSKLKNKHSKVQNYLRFQSKVLSLYFNFVRRESKYNSYNCVRKLMMCCQNSCPKWNTDAWTNKMFCTYFKTQNCKRSISIIWSKSEINSSTQKYSSQEITWIWSHKNPLLILKKCSKILKKSDGQTIFTP